MNPARRVLMLSASVGAGHGRAAQAVELALKELAPDIHVHNVDVLQLTNTTFRQIYGTMYFDLFRRAPHLLGFFYDAFDKPHRPGSLRHRLRLFLQRINLGRFERLVTDQPWDLAINTHFLPAEILAHLRLAGRSNLRQITVTTDFYTHQMWFNQPCEHYFTATMEGLHDLRARGVPSSQITASGIPIHPVFSRPKDRQECRTRHGLSNDRPVILQMAGGLGVGPVRKLSEAMLALEHPIELVVVCGKNESLRTQLQGRLASPRHRIQILGFTDKVDELMAGADLVMTKPGGLTTSETLASGAAMIIVSPIPGQETRNSDYLLEMGTALKIHSHTTLTYKVANLLEHPERLATMRASAARIARPLAAYEVARKALEMMGLPDQGGDTSEAGMLPNSGSR